MKPSLIEDGEVDGSAFMLRKGEASLSVNWLEAFGGDDPDQQLREVRRLFRLGLARNGCFAKLNVGHTKRYVMKMAEESGVSARIGISAEPLGRTAEFEADPSHAAVTGLPPADSDAVLFIGDLLADCVIAPLLAGKVD